MAATVATAETEAAEAAETAETTNMSHLLTVIITTSPTPSAPRTDLLSAVLASFRAHCPELLTCPVTVVFDTYDRVVPRARLKKGSVTAEEAESYVAYKDNVRQLVQDVWGAPAGHATSTGETVSSGLAEYGSPFIADNAVKYTTTRSASGQISYIEPEIRLGFGLAVRTAVREAKTPYVWIQQHDWTLASDIPLAAMLEVMQASEERGGEEEGDEKEKEEKEEKEEKDNRGNNENEERNALKSPPETAEKSKADWLDGIGALASVDEDDYETQDAEDTEEAESEAESDNVPVRYICMPSVRMLRYATSPHVVDFLTLRALTALLKRDFIVTPADETETESAAAPAVRLPLTPLFFWHDKTHLASRKHYLERVFRSRLALGRGDFIEDHIGQRARTLMKQDSSVWRDWACWLYYPDDGNKLCLRHLQGRTWRGEDKEREMRDMYRERNRSAASAAAEAAMLAAASVTAHKKKESKGTGGDS